jgi:hypothetical protein
VSWEYRRSGWRVAWVNRGPNAYMGRFGGGWKWCLGVEVGSTTVLLNLIWGYLRIDRRNRVTRSAA